VGTDVARPSVQPTGRRPPGPSSPTSSSTMPCAEAPQALVHVLEPGRRARRPSSARCTPHGQHGHRIALGVRRPGTPAPWRWRSTSTHRRRQTRSSKDGSGAVSPPCGRPRRVTSHPFSPNPSESVRERGRRTGTGRARRRAPGARGTLRRARGRCALPARDQAPPRRAVSASAVAGPTAATSTEPRLRASRQRAMKRSTGVDRGQHDHLVLLHGRRRRLQGDAAVLGLDLPGQRQLHHRGARPLGAVHQAACTFTGARHHHRAAPSGPLRPGATRIGRVRPRARRR